MDDLLYSAGCAHDIKMMDPMRRAAAMRLKLILREMHDTQYHTRVRTFVSIQYSSLLE